MTHVSQDIEKGEFNGPAEKLFERFRGFMQDGDSTNEVLTGELSDPIETLSDSGKTVYSRTLMRDLAEHEVGPALLLLLPPGSYTTTNDVRRSIHPISGDMTLQNNGVETEVSVGDFYEVPKSTELIITVKCPTVCYQAQWFHNDDFDRFLTTAATLHRAKPVLDLELSGEVLFFQATENQVICPEPKQSWRFSTDQFEIIIVQHRTEEGFGLALRVSNTNNTFDIAGLFPKIDIVKPDGSFLTKKLIEDPIHQDRNTMITFTDYSPGIELRLWPTP